MKKTLKTYWFVSVILVMFFFITVPSSPQMLQYEPQEDDIVVYLHDKYDNFYIEISTQKGEVYYQSITAEELTAYMESNTSREGTTFYHEVLHGDINDPVRGDCINHTYPTTWLPNSSWCYKNCIQCGYRLTKGHGNSYDTYVSTTLHNVRCTDCDWNHGNVAHSFTPWEQISPTMLSRTCDTPGTTRGCGYTQTQLIG